MKAAAITPGTKNSLKVIDVAEPEPGSREVRVDMMEAGICGTDEELNAGIIGEAPPGSEYLIIGHENFGTVGRLGPDVECLREGDLVVATVRRPCPERCYECRNLHLDMCQTGNYFERGIKKMHGYMAEHYVESPDNLVRVPHMFAKIAVLLEPMSIVEKGITEAFKMQERFPWRPKRALVAGTGPIGLLAALVLRDIGLETYAFATREKGSPKARVTEASGAHYVNVKEVPMEEIVAKHGPFDIIIEATGISQIAFQAISAVDRNGIVCLTGLSPHKGEHTVCTDCVNMDVVLNNKVVFGTVSANRMHYERGIDRMLSIESRWPGLLGRMLTRRVDLDHVKEGMRRTKDDIKVVVEIGAAG